MNKQQLASKIWKSANKMRSKIEANDYKDYILGFIFYKYLSDKEEEYLIDLGLNRENFERVTEDNQDIKENCLKNLGYFISYDNLFSYWINLKKDLSVLHITSALSAFDRLISSTHKKVFEGIFNTLQAGIPKLGDSTSNQASSIRDLIYLINEIPMDGKQGYDVLGFIYEYLISQFAANAGKKAGEFYTPHEVSVLMSEIIAEHLKDSKQIEIYDPTSGSGSLLINIGESISKHIEGKNNIKYFAQELKENTYNLTRMNLVMRGIIPNNIFVRNGDTLVLDWPYFNTEEDHDTTYSTLYVDAVVSNPPYSQEWNPDTTGDPRYAKYGIAPKSKADYAFLLHDLYHVKPDGIMSIVLPHGVLFRGGEEESIRKNLIEFNNIETIIGLPANVFFGTGIPTIIIILKHNDARKDSNVLFIDASKGYEKVGKNNVLRASDIKRITDTVKERKSVHKYARLVTKDEIIKEGYNLNIPRYVDSTKDDEQYDLYATMFGGIPKNELDSLSYVWNDFPSLFNELFESIDNVYYSLKSDNVSKTINSNEDAIKFIKEFDENFKDFNEKLSHELIVNMFLVNVSKQKEILSKDIFKRLQEFNLVDSYIAYQKLHNMWEIISIDLETIQLEGESALNKVDPNMITKKVKKLETTVQDGWVGRILPFELVQKIYFKEKNDKLISNNLRMQNISEEILNIFEELTEENKQDYNIFNDDNTEFKAKELNNFVKKLKLENFAEEDPEYKFIIVNKLKAEEAKLKKETKNLSNDLHEETKKFIESASSEQIHSVLYEKWINSLKKDILTIPSDIINNIVKSVIYLSDKYSTTMVELDKEINETEILLSEIIKNLNGNEYDMKGLSELKSLLKGD